MWCSKDSKFLIIFFLLMVGATCRGQYHPQYSQYMFNGLAVNPAYAGSKEVLNLAALYRSSQWGGSIEGAPVTQTFASDFPLRNPQLALGLLVFNDKISIFRQTGAYFAYAFRVKAGEGKLSFGLQAGFDLQHENYSGINIKDHDDELFMGERLNTFMPNVGTGVYYYRSNFFAGLSIPQLLAYSPNTANSYKGKPTPSNIMLYSGATVPAGRDLKVKPSALLQYIGTGLLFDANCNFALFKEKFEFGASWRSSNTLVGMVQFRLQSLCIGYAHDYALGKPSAINTSHEIMLRYDFRIMVNAVNPLHLR